MKVLPKPLGVAEVALRLVARRGRSDWAVLVVEHGVEVTSIAEELADEMESLGDTEVERVQRPRDPHALVASLQRSTLPVVVAGFEEWDDETWAALDLARSRLSRDERTALVMRPTTLESLMRAAPNFSSWLGASVWTVAPEAFELSDEARERRLETLRAWSGLTDAEVVGLAERGDLPRDPGYAEWLVLLRREELLGR